MMIFVGNIPNPENEQARELVECRVDETKEQAWHRQQVWLQGKTIGDPQSEFYTAEHMREMGYVGIYIPVDAPLAALLLAIEPLKSNRKE